MKGIVARSLLLMYVRWHHIDGRAGDVQSVTDTVNKATTYQEADRKYRHKDVVNVTCRHYSGINHQSMSSDIHKLLLNTCRMYLPVSLHHRRPPRTHDRCKRTGVQPTSSTHYQPDVGRQTLSHTHNTFSTWKVHMQCNNSG